MSDYGALLQAPSDDIDEIIKLTQRLTVAQTENALGMKNLTQDTMSNIFATKGIVKPEADALAAKVATAQANGMATFSLKAYTVALWENIKATVAWLLTNPVGQIITIVGAIGIALAAYNHFNVTIEEHKENIKKLKDEYTDLKDKLNSLKEEIETNKELIEELQEKQKNGVISLVEEDQLTKLRIQNDLLEEQAKIQEDLNKQKNRELAKENRETFEEDFGSSFEEGYADLEEVYKGNAARNYTYSKMSDTKFLYHVKANQDALDEAIKTSDKLLIKSLKEEQEKIQKELDNRSTSILETLLEYQNVLAEVMNPDGTFDNPKDSKIWGYIESWKKFIYKATNRPGEWNNSQIQQTLTGVSSKTIQEIDEKYASGTLTEDDISKYGDLRVALEGTNLILKDGETYATVFLQYLRDIAETQSKVKNSIPTFTFGNYAETIDKYQSELSTLSEALDKLRHQNLSESDLLDLLQAFPSLSTRTGDLSTALEVLINDNLKSLRETLIISGADQTVIDLFDEITKQSKNLKFDNVLSNLERTKSTINTVKEELADNDVISSSTLGDIATISPTLENTATDYLQDDIDDQKVIKALEEQYEKDLANYRLYIAQKNGEDETFYNDICTSLSQDLKDKAKSYNIDLDKYAEYSKAKLALDSLYEEKKSNLEKATATYDKTVKRVQAGGSVKLYVDADIEKKKAEQEYEEVKGIVEGFNSAVDDVVKNYDSNLEKSLNSGDKKDSFSNEIDWIAQSVENANQKVEKLNNTLANTEGFKKRLAVYEDIKKANNTLVTTTKNAVDEYEEIWKKKAAKIDPEYVKLITSTSSEVENKYNQAVEQRKSKYKGSKYSGNVDLYNRPILLNDDGYYETLKSETYNYTDFGIDKQGAFNVTPILPDGTKISNLEDYIWEQLDNGKSLEKLDIFLGGDYSSIDEAVQAAIALHEEQDAIYGAEAEYLRLLNEGTVDDIFSVENFTNEANYNDIVAAKEAYDVLQTAKANYEDSLNKQKQTEDAITSLLLEREEILLDTLSLEDRENMTAKELKTHLSKEESIKYNILQYNLALAESEEERTRLQKEYNKYLEQNRDLEYEAEQQEHTYKSNFYQTGIEDIQNEIALAEAKGGHGTEEQYSSMNNLLNEYMGEETAKLYAAKAKRDEEDLGSPEYDKFNAEVQEYENNLNNARIQQIENNKTMLKLPIYVYEEANKQLQKDIDLLEEKKTKLESSITSASNIVQGQIDYYNDLKDATTKSYDKQIEVIEKQKEALTENNDELKNQIALEKAQYELSKARNQKNIKVMRNGEFVYEADQEAIRSAQEELDNQVYTNAVADLDKQIKDLQEEKDKALGDLDTQIESLQNYKDEIDGIVNKYQEMLNLQTLMSTFGADIVERIMKGDTSAIEEMSHNYIENAQSIDEKNEEIKQNNKDIETITELAEAWAKSQSSIEIAQAAIKQVVENNTTEIAKIKERTETVSAMATEWSDTKLSIKENLDLININHSDAVEEEKLILEERLENIKKFASEANAELQSIQSTLAALQSAKAELDKETSGGTDDGSKPVGNSHSGMELGYIGDTPESRDSFQHITLTKLKPDEVPRILQVGEAVLTKMQQANVLENMQTAFISGFKYPTIPVTKTQPIQRNFAINGDIILQNVTDAQSLAQSIKQNFLIKLDQELYK